MKASLRDSGDDMLTREAMIARGAYGYLHKAVERFVPLDKVVALAPAPVCPDWGTYPAADMPALELKYSRTDDAYLAFNAAGLVEDARQRGERYIRAFVEPDGSEVGAAALIRPPDHP